MTATSIRLPLAGLSVVELGARVGASAAGSLLAQLGANVVFVESQAVPAVQAKWNWREQFAAGKQSLRIDAASAAERELLQRLAASADVLLVSSDLDPLAYGGSLLAAGSSGSIVCDLTAFGSSGPRRGQPASDTQVQALTGMMDATGASDGPPMAVPLPLIEQLAGVYAAAGVLAALRQREAGAAYVPVEVALYDVAFSAMTSFLAPALCYPDREQASRVGNRHTMAAPWNVYRARDGWVLLCAGNDDQWQRICESIDAREEGLAVHLVRNADRVAHVDEVDALVQRWVERHDIDECVQRFSALGIPCGPVAPMKGHPREANLEHRGMVSSAHLPDGRTIALPASPLRMSRTPGLPLMRVPEPDADRAAIWERLQSGSPAEHPGVRRSLSRPLASVRVIEIGHYTTAPVATRLMAALGAEVIKIEPPEGEAVRQWPPARSGQGIFFTFQNADKRSLCIDMASAEGGATLGRLLATADVLVENLRPGALARKGLGPEQLLAANPRLVYCSISGFGADSLYEGRPAFDTVIQAMSGLMAINRIGEMPLKTGPSLADVMGAAFGLVAVLAALEEREHSGLGQFLDLSMQDICSWATQAGWNDAAPPLAGKVVQRDGRFVLAAPDGTETPVLTTREAVREAQTIERCLWAETPLDGADYPVLTCPVRVGTDTPPLPKPGPTLGRDNEAILRELACD